jgi:alpha-beta hydrolase superfamily lysophospholipase
MTLRQLFAAPRPSVRLGALSASVALAFCAFAPGHASVSATETLDIRGHSQTLRLYGSRGGEPVIVSSGDGGWIHLGPHIAETLAAHGFFVVGFDVKSYLEGFTSTRGALNQEDVPGDYCALLDFARRGAVARPVLIGVSEGAGLSVLAAADRRTQTAAAGVVGVGLPITNELGWRWRDSMIYITHGVPNEPTFSTLPVIGKIAPLPVASIHSTHDEFVSREEAEQILSHASEPKKLWMVSASDHRFSDNLVEFDARLLEALAWIRERSSH